MNPLIFAIIFAAILAARGALKAFGLGVIIIHSPVRTYGYAYTAGEFNDEDWIRTSSGWIRRVVIVE